MHSFVFQILILIYNYLINLLLVENLECTSTSSSRQTPAATDKVARVMASHSKTGTHSTISWVKVRTSSKASKVSTIFREAFLKNLLQTICKINFDPTFTYLSSDQIRCDIELIKKPTKHPQSFS